MPFPIIPGGSPSSGYQVSRSLRFRSSASAYLSRTPASATNQTTWTWSGWVKRGALSSTGEYELFNSGYTASTTNYMRLMFYADNIYFDLTTSNTLQWRLVTNAVFRDPSAWMHIVAVYDSTNATSTSRARIYINGLLASYSSATYPSSSQSGLVNSALVHAIGGGTSGYLDGYLAEVNFIDGQALTPSSFGQSNTLTGVWEPKAYTGSYGTNGFYLPFTDNTNANTLCYDRAGSNTVVSTAAYFTPTGGVSQSSLNLVGPLSQLYDGVTTGQTTMYNNPVNSILQVDAGSGNTLDLTRWGFFLRNAFASETWSIQYSDDNSTWTNAKTGFQVSAAGWNDTTFTSVGAHRYWRAIVTTQVNGEYVTEYRLYGTGTYRTANDWTPNNISLASGTTYDSMIDSPTNYSDGTAYGRGNYAVISPINSYSSITISNANLTATLTEAAYRKAVATIAFPTSGKYYVEIDATGISYISYGIVTPDAPLNNRVGSTATGYGATTTTTIWDKSNNGVETGNFWSVNPPSNPTLQIAVDTTNGYLWLGYNNTWLDASGGKTGNPASETNATFTIDKTRIYLPAVGGYKSDSIVMNFNAGQRPFTYTPPSGFLALNTQNLPAPALTPSP